MGTWRCDTPGVDPSNRRTYPTEAAANTKMRALKLEGKRHVVVWCEPEPMEPTQTHAIAPLTPEHHPEPARTPSWVLRRLLGRTEGAA